MPSHRISISLHLWNVLSSPGRPNTMADSDDKRNVNAFFVMNLYSTALVPLNHIKTDVSLEEWEHVGKLSLPHDAIDLFIDFFFFQISQQQQCFFVLQVGWISSSRAEQLQPYVCRSIVQQKRNPDEMQLPLDWQSHQMSFTLSWSILYTKRIFITELEQSMMVTSTP